MKNIYTIIALALVIVLSATACQGPTGNVVREEKLKIGIILPLSGPIAEYGIATKNGIIMASEELKQDKYELIFEDGAYDAKLSISALNKLTDIDKVDAIMVWGKGPNQAIKSVADQKGIPIIAISSDSEATKDTENLIQVFPNTYDFSAAIIGYLKSEDVTKIGIVKSDMAFFEELYAGVQDMKYPGLEIELIDSYQTKDMDFKKSLLKIQQEDYDMIGVFLASGQIAQFHKSLAEMGIDIPIVGTDFYESYSEIENAKGTMDGAVFANFAVTEEFHQRYIDRFGSKSQLGFAGHTYDVMKMLVEKIDLTSTESYFESFRNIDSFESTLGTYTYIEDGDIRRLDCPIRLRTIVDEEIVTLN